MIRLANKNDVMEIYNLNIELFKVLSELRSDIYNPSCFSEQFIYSMIMSNKSDYILVEEDEKIIGYALLEERVSPYKEYDAFVEDHFAYIYEIVLLPEYRGKGYGSYMMDEIDNWAKCRNLTSIELNSLSNNYNALAFYENRGFEEYQVKLRKQV